MSRQLHVSWISFGVGGRPKGISPLVLPGSFGLHLVTMMAPESEVVAPIRYRRVILLLPGAQQLKVVTLRHVSFHT
jgi:hypothetical protein